MVSRRMLVTPLLAALLTLFTVACDGGARPTPTPGIRPTPTEARVTSTPEKNNSNQNIATPTPTFTEYTPTATMEPTPTPDIVNFPIIVECPPPACTPEELAYYNRRFREEFDYLTELFGIEPREHIVFRSRDGYRFWVDSKPVKVDKDQIETGDLTHELVHAILLTHVPWYDEGLADVGENAKYAYIPKYDSTGDLRFYDAIRRDKRIVEISPKVKGRIFFKVLRWYYGWDPRTDPIPAKLYNDAINGVFPTEDDIFDKYSKELKIDLSDLREVMSYLIVK